MNKGGFSFKRLIGVTRVKQNISRKIGIPLTRSGRQRKIGAMITGNGCIVTISIGASLFYLLSRLL